MTSLIETVIDYIFPPRCISCAEVLPVSYPDQLCFECHGLLERCENDAEGSNFSLYVYSDTIQHAIHRFKYGLRPAYGKYLGMLMADHAPQVLPRWLTVDIVVPVPLHDTKQRERGFNQAEILASAICERLGLTLDTQLLSRVRNTDHQAKLSADERRCNMRNAFAVQSAEAAANKTVLVIDDIYTTGSTVSECAAVLLSAGASRVFSYALSKAQLEETTLKNHQHYDNNLKFSKNANINDNLFR